MQQCMKRRLLYASSQAYQPRMETVGRSVGWLEPPFVIQRGLAAQGITDLALVGRVPDGVVVAFRGTLPPFFGGEDSWNVLLDWLNDGLSVCVTDPEYPGGVHLGFSDSMRRLWRDTADGIGVRTAVERMLDQSLLDRRARRHLFVTGHSKGGALANLFAWRAAGEREWRDLPVSVATIAAARAGNAEFARIYDSSRIACLRYELPTDLVPQLPPGRDTPGWIRTVAQHLVPELARADYRPVGVRVSTETDRKHRGWTGSRRRIGRGLLGRRGPGLDALVPTVLSAHAICPDSEYDRLICAGEGCNHGAML